MTLLWATATTQVAGAGTGLGATRGRQQAPLGCVFSGGELILGVFASLVVICFHCWIVVCSVYMYFEKIVQESAGAGDGSSWETSSWTCSGGCLGGVGRGRIRVLLPTNHPAQSLIVTPLKMSLV